MAEVPATTPRRELAFEIASSFSDDYQKISAQSELLRPFIKAFVRNMIRVRSMATFPIHAVAAAILNESASIQSFINKNIQAGDKRLVKGSSEYDEKLSQEMNAERIRVLKEWEGADPNFQSAAIQIGTDGLSAIINNQPEHGVLPEGALTTMAGMLVGLWTAFESLAQDIWIGAVNDRPIPLAERVLDPASRSQTADQSKTVSWKVFIQSKFDQRNSMGRILLQERKVDFQSLKNIRTGYKLAFAGELDAVFDAHDTELSLLEAVRNLFVHKGGVIDHQFKNRVASIPAFKDATIGYQFGMNGRFVAGNANLVIACAENLVRSVDDWLIKNPATSDADDAT